MVKLEILIENTLLEVDKRVEESSYLTHSHMEINKTKQILSLLKLEVGKSPFNIDNRVLRATHDLGIYAFRAFENSSLEIAIKKLIKYLYKYIPEYKVLNHWD